MHHLRDLRKAGDAGEDEERGGGGVRDGEHTPGRGGHGVSARG
jgi:hypothetical protein